MRYSIILVLLLLGFVTRAQQDTPKRASGPSSKGQTLVIVHFDIDKSQIRPQDRESLDSLVAGVAALDPVTHKVYIFLTGHTDNSGSDVHNIWLSQQRAYSVRDYLRSKGWPDTLFSTIYGFGCHLPLNDNSSPEKRALNRRVEILINHISPALTIAVPHPDTAVIIPDTSSATDDPNTIIYQRPPTLQEIFKDTTNLVGKNIVLRNVNFYGDRHVPLPGSTIILQELAAIMKEYPALHIEIQGYVCCMSDGFDGRDADTGTPDLSSRRAKFVYDFLVGQGIKRNRMSYKGFGASNKIYPEERDESQRTGNRRVEIKIISFVH
ncbi:MAG TPA: OmpA family protein [Puia sp.]|jgi:outer membrane protein OmpA-like peptidoglycan-associated protein|nr:OmpA family protein [Puia sp.]